MMKKALLIAVILTLLTTNPVSAFSFGKEKPKPVEKTYSIGAESGVVYTPANSALTYFGLSGSYKLNDRTRMQAMLGQLYDYSSAEKRFLINIKPSYRVLRWKEYNIYAFGLMGNFRIYPSIGAGVSAETEFDFLSQNLKVKADLGYTIDRLMIINLGLNSYF